ncbi:MAG TPA: acetylxylan esterase [Thermoanaerobaculia bacterium]|nr:acetylxylan esterase [Thermoanaerobaculia bacterium]
MRRTPRALACALAALLSAAIAVRAYDIPPELRTQLEAWAKANPRERGTAGERDWRYQLPPGVTTRQVTFYSDQTACYAKLFFPPGFTAERAWPAVVLGHGFNAVSIAIEKYGARFAERGLVAMVIDYRGYGFSDPFVSLLDPDPTEGDTPRETETTARVELRRTRLVAQKQAEDYRAAISFLEGEPGVDPERIGIWGSSHAGGVVITVAGQDARVKAVVAQVSSVGGRDRTGPARLEGELLEDAIQRARTGRGAEIEAGFSFRGLIDLETRQTGAEHRPWASLARIPATTAVLFLPAQNEELGNPRGPSGPFEAVKVLRGPAEVFEIPFITHFQVYAGPAFEVSSEAAAEWYLKHLGRAAVAEVQR